MRVIVSDVNFSILNPWVFKFVDSEKNEYTAYDRKYYKTHNLKSPVDKHHLDSLEIGFSANIEFREIDGENVVTWIRS
jgi:hypothetical protein